MKSIGFPAAVLVGFAVATCAKPCPGVGETWRTNVVVRFVAIGFWIVIVLLLVVVAARIPLTLNAKISVATANGDT